MIPRRIKLRGFLSYKEEQDIRFEGSPLWMLSGMNGSGKSSIFDAITFALFGHHRGGAIQASELMNKDSTQLGVEFEFSIDGEVYQITRTLKRNNQGRTSGTQQISKRIMDSLDDAHWEPVPDTNKKVDFDQWIGDKIGLNYETFTSSVLLLQGRAEKLLDSSPKGRAELLASIVDLERFQKLHERATTKKNALKGLVERIESQLAAIPEVTEMELCAVDNRIQDIGVEKVEAGSILATLQAREFDAKRWEELTTRKETLLAEQQKVHKLFAERVEIEKNHSRWQVLKETVPHLANIQQHLSSQEASKYQIAKLRKEQSDTEEKRSNLQHALEVQKKEKLNHETKLSKDQEEERKVNERRLELAGVMPKVEQYERYLLEAEDLRREKAKFRTDPERELKELQQGYDNLLEVQRVIPELKRFRERRDFVTRSQARKAELQQLEDKTKSEGQRLGQDLASARKQLASQEETHKALDLQVASSRTLVRQAELAVEEFQQVDGKKVCRYCGSPLTKGHLEEEQKRRGQELATSRQKLNAELKQRDQAHADVVSSREQVSRVEAELDKKREEYRTRTTEKQKLAGDIDNAVAECVHLYDNLPERFRVKISPRPPSDWTATTYPSPREFEELEGKRKEGDTLRGRLDEAKDRLSEWNRLLAREANLNKQLELLKRELPSKEVSLLREEETAVKGRFAALQSSIKSTDQVLKRTLAEIERKTQDLTRLATELSRIGSRISVEESSLTHFAEGVRQSQKLLPEGWREKALQIGISEVQQLKAELGELERDRIPERFGKLTEGRTLLDKLKLDLEDLDAQVAALPENARRPSRDIRTEIEAQKRLLTEIENRLKSNEKEQAILKRHVEQRQELLGDLLVQERDHNSYKTLSDLLGRDRLQRHLVRVAERQIVEYANSVLDRLSGGELSLRLSGSEEGASAERALDLEAFNRATADRAINVAFLSGSQRFRVAVSLALGIGQYASKQHRPIESVIIDEGFGCLDREGRQVMIQELQNLRSNLHCILLVSHQEEFADAFPDGYRFELQNGSTSVTRLRR